MKRIMKRIIKMKDLGIVILNELNGNIMMGAGIGMGIGGVIGARHGVMLYRWYKARKQLSDDLVRCNGDPECISEVEVKIDQLEQQGPRR